MFSEIIDVGTGKKSPVFTHVTTAPGSPKGRGGQN
jgi:hypothetical protein